MATLTIAIDPTVLEAIEREAERRHITLDQLVSETLSGIAAHSEREANRNALLRLIERSPLGDIGTPMTREEIYAERTWPRS